MKIDNYTDVLLRLMVDYKSNNEIKKGLKYLMDKKIAQMIEIREKDLTKINKNVGV